MVVLLPGEVTDGQLSVDATAKAVTAAAKMLDVTVLCAGARAADATKIAGVKKALCAEEASLGHRLEETTAALIVSLATTDVKNVLPRAAVLLDVMVISDVSGVVVSGGRGVGSQSDFALIEKH